MLKGKGIFRVPVELNSCSNAGHEKGRMKTLQKRWGGDSEQGQRARSTTVVTSHFCCWRYGTLLQVEVGTGSKPMAKLTPGVSGSHSELGSAGT